MPIIYSEEPISPKWLPNGHFQSIYPALFRKVSGIKYSREKIVTEDEDFLDLDWSYAGKAPSERLVILSHGLEGNSTRQYILGMVKILNQAGFDCLAWNFRGCGGEMNNAPRFYHSGATEDLNHVIEHAFSKKYQEIFLAGFSLGGNLTLKFLGEQGGGIDRRIVKAMVFSVPMDLKACSLAIIQPQNSIYMHRFLKSLNPKVKSKAAVFPDLITLKDKNTIRTLYDFDHHYTAPIHGFKSADDYYEQCSSMHFVEDIAIPTMIVHAANDPIVPVESLPIKDIEKNPNITLMITRGGGHCGFRPAKLVDDFYWSEKAALEFFSEDQAEK
ncbi:YheT family hydrolase [Dyadobacter luticola]|uniref:Alpha/beta fold hydrolase n=1 Tax=Dyadobacter luticola TaxID=1979387 RepID=A0A5R9KX72_9BACT|nr:alpha/beta fold hydrolase [Dyadobacter luticola]TLV00854.1 alpha/beta fold hydrolase [Dyadobacter luticola]